MLCMYLGCVQIPKSRNDSSVQRDLALHREDPSLLRLWGASLALPSSCLCCEQCKNSAQIAWSCSHETHEYVPESMHPSGARARGKCPKPKVTLRVSKTNSAHQKLRLSLHTGDSLEASWVEIFTTACRESGRQPGSLRRLPSESYAC